MKRRAWGILGALGVTIIGFHDKPARADFYTISNLGNYSGVKINDAGQVTGTFVVGSTFTLHSFLYDSYGPNAGSIVDLGNLGGPNTVSADLNGAGTIVGHSDTTSAGDQHAFIYSSGGMQDINSALGATASEARGINAGGQVVGAAEFGTGNSAFERPFLYSAGQVTILQTLGGSNSTAQSVNDFGQIVGTSYLLGDVNFHAFLFSGGTYTDITKGASFPDSNVMRINDAGQIIGELIPTNGGERAFLYSGGVLTKLGLSPSSTSSIANDINNAGQIVGADGALPFLYSNGTYTDLNSLIPTGTGLRILSGQAINDIGQIVARAEYSGATYTILLTPPGVPAPVSPFPPFPPPSAALPEPSSGLLLAVGSISTFLLGVRRVLHRNFEPRNP